MARRKQTLCHLGDAGTNWGFGAELWQEDSAQLFGVTKKADFACFHVAHQQTVRNLRVFMGNILHLCGKGISHTLAHPFDYLFSTAHMARGATLST